MLGLFYAGIILGALGITLSILGIIKIIKNPRQYVGKIMGVLGIIVGLLAFIGDIIVVSNG